MSTGWRLGYLRCGQPSPALGEFYVMSADIRINLFNRSRLDFFCLSETEFRVEVYVHISTSIGRSFLSLSVSCRDLDALAPYTQFSRSVMKFASVPAIPS